MSGYIRTKRGLPNTCSVCGKPQAGHWYAHNEDEARSGLGLCAVCAGVEEAPKPKRKPRATRKRTRKATTQ